MKKKTIRRVCLWAGLVIAGSLALTGFVLGKYATKIQAGSGSIQVEARLASSISVQESYAQRLESGEYTLAKDQIVTENSYILMPGVDIPKDPQVIITGKTEVPAYLYLTVNCNNDAISYSLQQHWVQVEGNTYVYSDKNGDPIALTSTPDAISILENDTVYVSHQLLVKDQPAAAIQFVATLKEVGK